MQVRAFVRSDSRSAQLSTPIVTVARMMAEQAVRVLPVADGERFVGLVTDWDISCRAVIDGMDLERATVRDVMPDGQPRCTGNTELEQAVAMLDSAHAYGLTVYDSDDSLLGWVHRHDIASQAAA
jgi:predicted transcriptional regulator